MKKTFLRASGVPTVKCCILTFIMSNAVYSLVKCVSYYVACMPSIKLPSAKFEYNVVKYLCPNKK